MRAIALALFVLLAPAFALPAIAAGFLGAGQARSSRY